MWLSRVPMKSTEEASVKFPALHVAIEFATHAHFGQDRKYTEIPYISHPINVMEIVRTVTDDEHMLIAAVLHDVVEDTPTTIEQINAKFGEQVALLVADLTDVSKSTDGNREQRKKKDREHTASACPDAKTIKLADLIHNAESIVRHDEHFAKVFMREKQALLQVLKEGNEQLWERAHAALQEYQNNLLQDQLAK